MDIRDIRLVRAVALAGSYNRAAEELFVSHQAVSKAIRRIEGEARDKLFERIGTGVCLTEFGRAFLEEAEPIVGAFEAWSGRYLNTPAVRREGAPRTEQLSIALVTGGSIGLPDQFFDLYSLENPTTTMQVEEMSSDNVVEAITRGNADIGILGTHPDLVREFDIRPIIRMGIWLLVPEGSPLARRGSATLADLDRRPMVTAGQHNHLHRIVMERCREEGVSPDVVAVSTDASMIVRLSEKFGALFFGFDPRIMDPAPGTRAVRLDFDGAEEFGTYAIRRRDCRHTGAAGRFWESELEVIG